MNRVTYEFGEDFYTPIDLYHGWDLTEIVEVPTETTDDDMPDYDGEDW